MQPPGRTLSPFPLFHPHGFIHRSLVIGSNCPAHLFPEPGAADSAAPDLVLLSPTERECREPGWLAGAVSRASICLAPDGLLYAAVPWRWRAAARGMLEACGLLPGSAYAHLPDWQSSRYLVPLQPAPARYAFESLFPTRVVLRLLALAALRFPAGSRLDSSFAPWAGFTAQRAGSRAPFDWLYRLADVKRPPRSVIVSGIWRGEHGSLVLHCFDGNPLPRSVAKLSRSAVGESGPAGEIEHLTRLGPSARQAGARIPTPTLQARLGPGVVFLQEALEGRSAAAVLAGRPGRVLETLEGISAWLEAWNLATRQFYPLSGERGKKAFLDPIASLAGQLPDPDDYCAWLQSACAALNGPVPFVAAHQDLTLWNILITPGQPPAIVDWAEAQPAALPLVDLLYVVLDAVRTAHRYHILQAFQECFSPRGQYYPPLKRWVARLEREISMPAGLARLCLHACFLHHARNEARRADPGEPRPFLQILGRLAQDRSILAEL